MGWQRLEWTTVGADLVEGPEARIADPLWLLGRQWQVGELTGDDAASPLLVDVTVQSSPVTRFQPGAPDDDRPVLDVADLGWPLETAVEAEPVRSGPTATRLAAEAGLQLLRALAEVGADPALPELLAKAHPLVAPPDDGLDPVGRAQLELLVARSFDAAGLRQDPDSLPELSRPPADRAVAAWLRWYDRVVAESDDASWQSSRMEHRFRVVANPGREVVLDAPEYVGGTLDWYSFDVDGASKLRAPTDARERSLTVLPSRASYAGQAASRWWEMEDAETWFGDLHDAPEDLPRLALGAYGLTFGDDWYRVPVSVPAGSLVRTRRVRILDSFGQVHRIRSCAELDGPERVWRFFELTGDGSADARELADRSCPWLLVAPALPDVVEGDAIEEVALLRDEVANVGWAVERLVESGAGRVVDRAAMARAAWSPPPAVTGRAWQYRLADPVPANLVPLLPVEVQDGGGLHLQRGRLAVSVDEGDPTTQGAVGRLLEADRQLLLEDAEVPASGVVVTRSWQSARTMAGELVTWVGRRKGVGRPVATPGTTFDEVDRREA